MPWENCWIIMTIDYVTGWPVTKAVLNAMKATVADFLCDKIFTNYDSLRELLSNNSINFLSCVVIYYLKKLKTQHKIMTLYHFCTNEKIENLNETLSFMLTKYLMSKSTQLWNKYLSQALFAAWIQAHSITKQSSFYLLYEINSQLSGNSNNLWSLRETDFEDQLKWVKQVQIVQAIINEILLWKVIESKTICDETVQLSTTKKEDWVLIQNEESQKFKAKWFKSYKVLKTHSLETYALEMLTGCVLQNLIHNNWLVKAHTFDANC